MLMSERLIQVSGPALLSQGQAVIFLVAVVYWVMQPQTKKNLMRTGCSLYNF